MLASMQQRKEQVQDPREMVQAAMQQASTGQVQ